MSPKDLQGRAFASVTPSPLHPFTLSLFLLLTGCGGPFDPEADDLRISRERLRVIEPLDLARVSESPPTTAPTTIPATRPAPVPPAEMPLTVEEVRQLALQNNLDLRVELLNPPIARTAVTEEEARFEWLLFGGGNFNTFDSPTGTRLESSQAENLSATAGVEAPLITGGTVRLEAPFNRSQTDNEFSLLNPAYEQDAAVTLTHPLLRGFGVESNYQLIRIARYEYQASQARTKLEVIRALAEAERTYWLLYAARQELELRRRELELAEAQLARARRQAQAGALREVEVVRAQAGVAERVEAIILAENELRDRQRALKRIINVPGVEMGTPTVLIPATEPEVVRYDLDPERLAEAALQTRMEMLELELRIASEVSNVNFARNQTLPLASFDYTYNVNGLGRSPGEAIDVLRDVDYEDHRVGLRVEIPIGNQAALSRLRRALLNRLQALATREQRALQIRQEVYDALDLLGASWQRILAARQRVVLEARVVELEIRQFNVGVRTTTEVLEAQARLADARSSEIRAMADYQIAQIDLAFATGTLLGRSRVVWDPAPMPK